MKDDLAPIKYSLVKISELFTSKNFPQKSRSQIEEMKDQFTKAINSLCDNNNCRPPPPDMPLPSVTTKFVFTKLVGGQGGSDENKFENNGISPYMRVKNVRVCSGHAIYSIQFKLSNGLGEVTTLGRHGRESGDCTEWSVDDDDAINTAEVYTGSICNDECLYLVVGLKLNTKKNKDHFWGNSGDYTVCIK